MAALSVHLEGRSVGGLVFNPCFLTSVGPGPGVTSFTFDVQVKDSRYREDLVGHPFVYHLTGDTSFVGVLEMERGPPSPENKRKLRGCEVWRCHMRVDKYL